MRLGPCASVALAVLLALTAPAAAAPSFKVAPALRAPTAVESFGAALAADADHIVAGAFFEDALGTNRPTGAAYVYRRSTGTLLHRLLSPQPGTFFGSSVALQGSLLAVAEPRARVGGIDDMGSVHLFDPATGTLLRSIPNPGTPPNDPLGHGTAIVFGGGLFVSAPTSPVFVPPVPGVVRLHDPVTGAVLRTFTDPAPAPFDTIGSALALSHDEVLVGAAARNTHGVVYRVARATGDVIGVLTPPDPEERGFGTSIAVVGNLALVGAPGHVTPGSHGAVHVFDLQTGERLRTLRSPIANRRDGFGAALAVRGDHVIVTAPTHDPVGTPAAFLVDPVSGQVLWTFVDPLGPTIDRPRFPGVVAVASTDVLFGSYDGTRGSLLPFVNACGDGVQDPCERCDDGNRTDGDGCSATCELESCGDGVHDVGEECDDGNALDGDGCDRGCVASACGNCVVAPGEVCDDGNGTTGDGCDPGCLQPACGNGVRSPYEPCDDGNLTPGDGCSPLCRVETCANGTLDAGESCDDANDDAGDGCDEHCRLEGGRLDWWRSAFDFYGGDFNSFYGRRHIAVRDGLILALVHNTIANVYDGATGALAHRFAGEFSGPIEATADGLLVGHLPLDKTLTLYDPTTFAVRQTFTDPTPSTNDFGRSVTAIAGRVLVRDTGDDTVYVFDATTGSLNHALVEPAPVGDPGFFGVRLAALGPHALIAGSASAHLFDLESGAHLRSFRVPRGESGIGAWTAVSGTDVLLPTVSGVVHVYDSATGARRGTLRSPTREEPGFARFGVNVTSRDIVIAGMGVVHVFDAATLRHRHSIPAPDDADDACFGSHVHAVDAGLAVSSPCAGDDDEGIVHVFEHEHGDLLAVIPNPHGEFEDRFRTVASYDTTFLARYENFDDGRFHGYRPCADGVLEPGEECDDANLASGDGCDVNCTVSRCGNGIRAGDESCDDGNRTDGDGCNADCMPELVCLDGRTFGRLQVAIHRLGDPAGDEKLVLSGRLTGASLPSAAIVGAQLLIEDVDGSPVVDLTARTAPIPADPHGAGCGPRDGWRTHGARELYANRSNALDETCTPGSAQGLRRLRIEGRGTETRLRARGAAMTILPPTAPLRVTLVLGDALGDATAGRCATYEFDASECRRTGKRLTCRMRTP